MPSPTNRQRLLYILVGLLVGAIATSAVWAVNGGSTEVRIGALVHDDGRVEVGLQQRDASAADAEAGEWRTLQAPMLRVVPPDAERGRWLYSSPITVEVATDSDATQDSADAADSQFDIGPFQILGTPTGSRPFDDQTLFCVVTHGHPSDFFWYQVYSAFADVSAWYNITLRAEMRETGAEQATAIDECVADGAAAIATTLADADALAGALGRAQEAGVRLLTFNSGSDRATELGAVAHVALDEQAVGRVAAETFANHDVTGDILCIIHEPTNRGLEQRCDSLEATYDAGDVVRVRIAESDLSDTDAIAAALTDSIGGAIALNANTAYAMSQAIAADHPDVVLGAVSADFPRPLAMLATDGLDFVLWSHALEQGYHAVTALLFAHGTPFPREVGLFAEATQLTIQPTVITADSVAQLREQGNQFGATLPAWLDALEQSIEAESSPSESEETSPSESAEVPPTDSDEPSQ